MTEDFKEKSNTLTINFESHNRLTYIEGKFQYIMTLTKKAETKQYFGCINRHLSSSNPQRCNATGVYDNESKQYTCRKIHVSGCGKEASIEFTVSDSYDVQKQLLFEELIKNPRLTATPGLELLMKINFQRPPEKNFFP